MKLSENVYCRELFFFLSMKERTIVRNVYASLLKGPKMNVLIDSGVSYNYADIVQLCAQAGLTLQDLDLILVTHFHPDHVGGLARLKKECPHLQVWCHKNCRPYLESIDYHYKIRPVPPKESFYFMTGDSIAVDKEIEDGETIDIGYQIQAIFAPGHSIDSLCFYVPEEKLLIAGDLLPDIHGVPIYENLTEIKRSLEKVKRLPVDTIISSFVGPIDAKTSDIYEEIDRYFELIQTSVNKTKRENPNASMEEYCIAALKAIQVDSPPVVTMFPSIQAHIEA